MQRRHPRWRAGLLFLLASAAVHARDGGAEGHAPDPDADAEPKPAPSYVSPFHGYRSYTADAPLHDWRRVNDEVGQLGGHVGQLERDADRAAPAAPAGHGHGGPR